MAVVTNTFTRYAAIGIREELANVILTLALKKHPL